VEKHRNSPLFHNYSQQVWESSGCEGSANPFQSATNVKRHIHPCPGAECHNITVSCSLYDEPDAILFPTQFKLSTTLGRPGVVYCFVAASVTRYSWWSYPPPGVPLEAQDLAFAACPSYHRRWRSPSLHTFTTHGQYFTIQQRPTCRSLRVPHAEDIHVFESYIIEWNTFKNKFNHLSFDIYWLMMAMISFNGIEVYWTLFINKNAYFHLHINDNFTLGPMHMRPETLVIVKWISNIKRSLTL
jgi:hypothetical protein